MANELISTVAVSTTLGAALVAGIFFAFSTFVMTALSRLLPEQGIAAMQSINVAVLNPWFFAVFFGTALGSIALALLGILNWGAPGSTYLVSGSLLYLIGCILVTIVFNVPLNHALAAVEPGSTEGAEMWTRYLSTWTTWNHLRTVASLAAAASFIMAIR
ncbi:MAG: DUF1772 domain-containing protein [Alphaproteobacteria bacterium]